MPCSVNFISPAIKDHLAVGVALTSFSIFGANFATGNESKLSEIVECSIDWNLRFAGLNLLSSERKCCHWQFRAPFRLLAKRRVNFMANGSSRVIYVLWVILGRWGGYSWTRPALRGGVVLNYALGEGENSRLGCLFNSLLGRRERKANNGRCENPIKCDICPRKSTAWFWYMG